MIRDSNRFFSKLCTLSGACFPILDVQMHVFFWSNKTAYRFSFFDFRAPLKIWRCGASIPYLSHAKRALHHLSYIATSPLRKRGDTTLWNLSSVVEIVEQSPLLPIVVLMALDAGHQSMCFSHATRLPSRLTCLAGGVHMSCLCQTDVFDCLISRVYVSFDVLLR